MNWCLRRAETFRLLNLWDCVAVSHVSRDWRALALNDPLLWKDANLSPLAARLPPRYAHHRVVSAKPSRPELIQHRADMFLELLQRSFPLPFRLTWSGSRIPRVPHHMVTVIAQHMERMQTLALRLGGPDFHVTSFRALISGSSYDLPARWDAPVLARAVARPHSRGNAANALREITFLLRARRFGRPRDTALSDLYVSVLAQDRDAHAGHFTRHIQPSYVSRTVYYAPLLRACARQNVRTLYLETASSYADALELFTSTVVGTWLMNADPLPTTSNLSLQRVPSHHSTARGRAMLYEEVKAASLQVSQQLADPLRAQICPQCLAEFAYGLTYTEAGHVPRLRLDCHQLFDHCVLVFLTPRTPDEVARFYRAAVMCSRHRSRSDGSAMQRLGLFLDSVETIVSLGLHAGSQSPSARALNTLKSFASRSGRWPARLEQLLPFGAEQAVARLVELAELRVAGGPIAMLANCVIMARAAVLPVLLADLNRLRLLAVLCKSLTTGETKFRWREDSRTVVVGFLEGMLRGPGALPRDFELLVAGSEMDLYRAVCDAVSNAPESLRGVGILLNVCTKLYWMLGARVPDVRAVPPLPTRAQQHLSKTTRPTTRESAYALLVHALIRQAGLAPRCAAPGCGASALRGGDRAKFQVCARCRVLRYCSKACQSRAWTEDEPPHKAVCAVLCRFDAQKYVQSPVHSFDEQYMRVLPILSDNEVEVFNAWLTACRDEFGTLSELFVGPVDVRGVDSLGKKSLKWLALATVCITVFAFICLPFAWAIVVTLLAVGFAIWQIVRPFIPVLMLRYRGVIQ